MEILENLKQFTKRFKTQPVDFLKGPPAAVIRNPNSPTTAIVFCFRDGVAYESEDRWGISHFVEHILFRGTEQLPTLYDISRRVESIGGRISAYSTRKNTAFWVKTLPGQERESLYVLEQLLLHPRLEEKFIESERNIIQQERYREINNPSFYSSLMVESLLLWPEPISRPPVGEDRFIQKVNAPMLREYIKKVYNRNNMTVAASGNLSDQFEEELKKVIDRFPEGSKANKARFVVQSKAAKAPVVLLPTHHKSQVYLSMGWKFPIKSQLELFTWRIINTLMGAGYTSLLNRLLRERENITYLCTTSFNSYGDKGVFKIKLALADVNLAKAVNLIDNLLLDLKESRIANDIFAEAVIRHASNLVFQMEDSLETAKILVHSVESGSGTFSFSDYLENLQRVNLPMAADVAGKNLIPKNRKIFVMTSSHLVFNVFPDVLKLERDEQGNPLIW